MVRCLIVCGCLALLLAVPACRQDNNPPPPHNEVMSADGQSYMPIRLKATGRDESLLGAAASTEEAKPAKAAAAEPVEIVPDTTSAEGVARSYAELVNAGMVSRLPEVLVAEQGDAVTEVAETLSPVSEAIAALKRAVADQLPDAKVAIPGAGEEVAATVENPGDAEAEVKLTMTNAAGETTEMTAKARKVEEAWRLEVPDLETRLTEAATAAEGKLEQYRNMTARVRAGEFKDAEALTAELEKIGAGTYEIKEVAGGEPAAGEPPAEGEQPAEPTQ